MPRLFLLSVLISLRKGYTLEGAGLAVGDGSSPAQAQLIAGFSENKLTTVVLNNLGNPIVKPSIKINKPHVATVFSANKAQISG